jgi:aryl-alcohol dehydrogenase-like predicted oxidoreductase
MIGNGNTVSAGGRRLGRTGVTVHPIGLGAMPLSLEGRPSAERALDVIRAFVEAGGTLIDTANAYCIDNNEIGHNERLIRDCVVRLGARDKVLIATKGGLTRPQGRWETDGRPAWIRASCEKSLADLDVTCIDLYQLHAVDPKVPFTETLGELMRLREEGKIRHIGLSNVDAGQLQTALRHVEIVSVQNRCHLLAARDLASGLVALCGRLGVTYIAHSPVGGHYGHTELARLPLLRELAAAHGCSAYGIALAWLLARGEHIVPIPGASRVESITDSLAATGIRLGGPELGRLDALALG